MRKPGSEDTHWRQRNSFCFCTSEENKVTSGKLINFCSILLTPVSCFSILIINVYATFVEKKMVRAACVPCHGSKCPLLTVFIFFLSARVTFLQEGVNLGF